MYKVKIECNRTATTTMQQCNNSNDKIQLNKIASGKVRLCKAGSKFVRKIQECSSHSPTCSRKKKKENRKDKTKLHDTQKQ